MAWHGKWIRSRSHRGTGIERKSIFQPQNNKCLCVLLCAGERRQRGWSNCVCRRQVLLTSLSFVWSLSKCWHQTLEVINEHRTFWYRCTRRIVFNNLCLTGLQVLYAQDAVSLFRHEHTDAEFATCDHKLNNYTFSICLAEAGHVDDQMTSSKAWKSTF